MMRKGQMAMEYMTTYGWAIVVVILVFVVLMWLGVFGTGLSDSCNLNGATLACQSFKASTGSVQMMIRNNGGNDIVICDIICDSRPADPKSLLPPKGAALYSNCESTGTRILSTTSKTVYSSQLPDGPSFCTHDGVTPVAVGDRYRGKVYVVYNGIGDGGSANVMNGDVLATIQP